MPSDHAPVRDYTATVLVALLFAVLLLGARDILIPPVVFPILAWGLWGYRDRPGIVPILNAAGALTVLWVLYAYGHLLGPLVLAFVIAYLLAPLVGALERRRFPRGPAVLVVTVPVVALLITLVALSGPQLFDQASSLLSRGPGMIATVLAWLDGVRDRLALLPFLSQSQREWLQGLDAQQAAQFLRDNADKILRQIGAWAVALTGQLGTLFGFLGYLIISPVMAYYLLRDWDTLLRNLRELIPPARRPAVSGFLDEFDTKLGRFVRGQILEATIVGTLTAAGLAIFGVPNAFLLGLIAGVFNLVPYIGFAIAAIPALIVALTMPDPGSGFLRVSAVYLAVQFLDSNVTGPRIVGSAVGLHPVTIMLALTFGGALLGFVGLVLAVPLAVLVKMIYSRAIERYRGSAFYQAGSEAVKSER